MKGKWTAPRLSAHGLISDVQLLSVPGAAAGLGESDRLGLGQTRTDSDRMQMGVSFTHRRLQEALVLDSSQLLCSGSRSDSHHLFYTEFRAPLLAHCRPHRPVLVVMMRMMKVMMMMVVTHIPELLHSHLKALSSDTSLCLDVWKNEQRMFSAPLSFTCPTPSLNKTSEQLPPSGFVWYYTFIDTTDRRIIKNIIKTLTF